ncbi:hypothetical protein HD806DRAFT_327810 [Xylariaceae sp. AK1471]|nr:hypothetical protein HD806DRAFT_327810 [Xylariaceae sp. AK1471]
MTSELRRPPTRKDSGSRPPTSRFQEGSMNDRISAAPPAQFMGPQQLKNYENQFYTEQATQHEARKQRPERPHSTTPYSTIHPPPQQQVDTQHHTVTHKKSTGFFGRVRDALFNRGGAGGGQQGQILKQQEVRRKHSSLQEPLQHPPPSSSRPDYLHAARSQSEVNITQILPNYPRGSADRPSREDIMASYNQLVATGFFQSHAIQSTRHAAPPAAAGRETPVLPAIEASPRPPVRVSSVHAPTGSGPGSASPIPSPHPQGRTSREYSTAAAPRFSLSYTPSTPDLHTKDSRNTLRSRKRTRGDVDETLAASPEPQSSTSYFAQPLKRVAKKLRKMPSLTSQTSTSQTGTETNNAFSTAHQPSHQTAADGIVRLVPSISSGGTLHPMERAVRLRSPSPAAPEMTTTTGHDEWNGDKGHDRAGSATGTRRPRRTFSYTLTESVRGRGRTSERERDMNRLHKRDSSATRSSSKTRTHSQNPLGPWQRVSLEDTIIHRDSSDSIRPSEREWERTTSPSPTKTQSSPLKVLPDVNRGIPSVPKVPERWHGTGKAYHLKDRGSRPELVVRRPEDSGKSYGKENSAGTTAAVDVDGNVDMVLTHETETRAPPRERKQQQQWCIGNAL